MCNALQFAQEFFIEVLVLHSVVEKPSDVVTRSFSNLVVEVREGKVEE